MRYVLITAARNESRYIANALRSVVAQSVLPVRWVVVSDGSTDATDEIVKSYAQTHTFITLLRIEDGTSRNFASQAYALNHALSAVWADDFQYIGCLDADISLDSDYYQRILAAFSQDPTLGVAGGFIHEQVAGRFKQRSYNSRRSVAGAIQMFRRECFARIGAFTPVPHGGLDTVAELKARMLGFHARSFPELKVYHLRRTGGEGGLISASFKAGLMEFEIGYHPIFEFFVCARRVRAGIPLLSSAIRFIGFASAYLTRPGRMVSSDMMAHLRREQMSRLLALAKAIFLCTRFDRPRP
jgi:biofilm PGA synthesis N-glycosyltransferase PgaC